MAHEQPPPVRFIIPDNVRTFTPFSRLPAEIRYDIWEKALHVQGMHFLRLETKAPRPPPLPQVHSDLTEEEDDDAASEASANSDNGEGDPGPAGGSIKDEPLPDQFFTAQLAPLYPTPKADLSFYVTLNSMLARLAVTCPDADRAVQHLLRNPRVLRLSTGRVVSLDGNDVICLEYLPDAMFESGCRMPMDVECEDLKGVRRLAVRYCHKWEERTRTAVCENCGRVHDIYSQKVYPVHLFQFLARYLPSLETFYFIDYLILRKPQEAGKPKTSPNKACFQSGGGRTYYEVNSEDWNVKSRVFETLTWLGDSFRRYASESKLNTHPRPQGVQFKVLACEWAPVPEQALQVPATTGWLNKRVIGSNKRLSSQEDEVSNRKGLSPRHRSQATFAILQHPQVMSAPAPRFGGVNFVFGEDTAFDFTFQV